MVMVCASLWTTRNDLVWRKKQTSIEEIIVSSNLSLYHWLRAQNNPLIPWLNFLILEDGTEHWTKPINDLIKVNVDATIFDNCDCHSFACVARNNTSLLLSAISSCRLGVFQLGLAEAIGVNEALSWIKRNNWEKIVVEMDCFVLVQAIHNPHPLNSYFDAIVEDCQRQIETLRKRNLIYVLGAQLRFLLFRVRVSFALSLGHYG
ncbi:uncharacterized protein LOC133031284 [Cannabis sativa]|uniref:uncharacterized protein LOC133031284 n=1 Tax=Cannabis sativa TaxID=3483 RepID=UPI0029CA147A|nr:uncharacterized protein LOC133031284 [Cannabis sativa]